MWEIYLIHHAHTDVGFTESQEKVELYHYNFIQQAIHILMNREQADFKWQCENYWQVENFYHYASSSEKENFAALVRSGKIGLSGNYLNMTEVVDYETLSGRICKAASYAKGIGIELKSAMSADTNGYGWGYADALAEHGVENLFCALHSHHGMFPMGHNPSVFYWQSPRGKKVLTFVGEHYHLGNELGFSPHAAASYMLHDDVRSATERRELYRADEATTEKQELEVAQKRITRYLQSLGNSHYPLSCVPLMVSGVNSDNAPPNEKITERVKKLNRCLEGYAHIRLSTLDDFFLAVRNSGVTFETYSGDFPDWWANGIGSQPNIVKLYRDAQRKMRLCGKLDSDMQLGSEELMEQARQNAIMFAEHTWSYSSSASEPWSAMVKEGELKHQCYAISAHSAATRNLNQILHQYGEIYLQPDRPHHFRIINPNNFTFRGPVAQAINFWEYFEGRILDRDVPLKLKNRSTGELLDCQVRPSPRGMAIETVVCLAPHEILDVELCTWNESNATVSHVPHLGADSVADFSGINGMETPWEIDTPYFHLKSEQGKGIVSVIFKQNCQECLSQQDLPAFSGVYEFTPMVHTNEMDVRRMMGRNRSSIATLRAFSVLQDARIIESGDIYVLLRLFYRLDGVDVYQADVKVYKTVPLIEANIRVSKRGRIEPENLYVALPFILPGNQDTYIEKIGCSMRPGIDQLPGTCQEFFAIQNGLVRKGQEYDAVIVVRDTPLVCFGNLEAKPVVLCDGKNTALNHSCAYAWIMNNYWETNFPVNLGGDYEFCFRFTMQPSREIGEQMQRCAAINEGLLIIETGQP